MAGSWPKASTPEEQFPGLVDMDEQPPPGKCWCYRAKCPRPTEGCRKKTELPHRAWSLPGIASIIATHLHGSTHHRGEDGDLEFSLEEARQIADDQAWAFIASPGDAAIQRWECDEEEAEPAQKGETGEKKGEKKGESKGKKGEKGGGKGKKGEKGGAKGKYHVQREEAESALGLVTEQLGKVTQHLGQLGEALSKQAGSNSGGGGGARGGGGRRFALEDDGQRGSKREIALVDATAAKEDTAACIMRARKALVRLHDVTDARGRALQEEIHSLEATRDRIMNR